MEGTTIAGRYRVDALIGEGGMARVYRGTDTTLDRPVAIKILREELSHQEDVVSRFRREAHSAAKLSHANIVQVYDTGVDAGKYYIVMEYLPEADLKQIIEEYAPLPLRKVLEFATPAAEALDYAHRAGIVHRDVKPQNMLFSDSGQVKLSDFGIAAAAGSPGLTADGKVLGSAHYISPEQAQGASAGPASDIYSLGVVLYEALTGRLPFDGETAADIAAMHLRETPPSPRSVNPNLSPEAEFVINKAMARDPQRRYRNVAELLVDLRKLAAGAELDQTGVLTPSAMPEATIPLPRTPAVQPPPAEEYDAPAAPVQPRPDPVAPPPERQASSAQTVLAGIGVGLLIILVIAAVFLLVKAAFYPGGGGGPTTVGMPNLLGLTEQEARSEIEERGLVIGRVDPEHDEDQPVGKITDQYPSPGQVVEAGTKVDLVVNLGKEVVSVIDVVGETVPRAQALLEAAGLTLGEVRPLSHETVPADVIFEQDAKPGTQVEKGVALAVSVSAGPEDVAVPDEPADANGDGPAAAPGDDGNGDKPVGEALDPVVEVHEDESFEDPVRRKFNITVSAMGDIPDQVIEVRWRQQNGGWLVEDLGGALQPGESKTATIIPEGTVTIEVYQTVGGESRMVYNETRPVDTPDDNTQP